MLHLLVESMFNDHIDISGEFLTVKLAAEISGYNQQYLRRMLRNRAFKSRKIGQIWLIERKSFWDYLYDGARSVDKRFGPQSLCD
jgi:hypothetical protein